MKRHYLGIAFFIALCLSGCAGKDAESDDTGSEVSDEFSFDWYTQTLPINGQIEDNFALSVTDFHLREQKEPEDPDSAPTLFYGTDGANFYTLESYFQSESAENTRMSIFNPAEGTQNQLILPMETLAEDPASLYVTAASMLSPEEFSFQVSSLGFDDKGRLYPEQYRVICMDYQGQVLSDVDMLPLYESQGMISPDTLNSVEDCLVDGNNCIYTRKGNGILIADSDGSFLMEKSYGDEDHVTIEDPVRSEDGKLIFPVKNSSEKTVRLMWFEAANAKEYTLAELEYSSFQKLYAMHGGHIYYGTLEGIIDWDINSGNRSFIFSYKDNAIMNPSNAMLAFDSEGKLLLRVIYENEDMVLMLGEKAGEQGTVRIADISGSRYNLLKSETAAFSRRNPLYLFSYEQPEEGMETAFRDRIMAELTSGTGPDILYLSREDLVLLGEKGIWADMEEYLSQDTLRELLPGAVELGRIDGILSGIPGEVAARTIFTRPESQDANGWSVSDILSRMRQTETIEAILPTTSDALLYYLALLDLEHSPFIDWENNTCRFSEKDFVDILKAIKTYSLEETLVSGNDWEMLREGKCLGVTADILSFKIYENYHVNMGEEISATGFPSESGNGNYLAADGILAVNVNSARKEAVSDFLEYVLSAQGQSYCNIISVRKNMLTEDMISYDENNSPYLMESENVRVPLETKKDGSVYIRQYNEFLENCVPLPDSYYEIADIISEEARGYFYGDKTPEQTAEVIGNRVQTYLDEHY